MQEGVEYRLPIKAEWKNARKAIHILKRIKIGKEWNLLVQQLNLLLNRQNLWPLFSWQGHSAQTQEVSEYLRTVHRDLCYHGK